jgi:hypothetical protein
MSLNRARAWARAIAKSAPWEARWFGWALLLLWLALSVWWYFHVPSPGKAVAALAVAAAMMSLRPQVSTWEKSAWMVVLCAFLFLELQAINSDRAAASAQVAEERQHQDHKFAAILDENQKAFDATMAQTKSLTELSTENLNQVTGGNSYPFVMPAEFMPEQGGERFSSGSLHIHGANPLHGVNVSAFGPEGWITPGTDYGTVLSTEIGRGRPEILFRFKDGSKEVGFNVWINASNGTYFEYVRFRKSPDDSKWRWAFRVWRGGDASPNHKIILTKAEQGFGAVVNWSKP